MDKIRFDGFFYSRNPKLGLAHVDGLRFHKNGKIIMACSGNSDIDYVSYSLDSKGMEWSQKSLWICDYSLNLNELKLRVQDPHIGDIATLKGKVSINDEIIGDWKTTYPHPVIGENRVFRFASHRWKFK